MLYAWLKTIFLSFFFTETKLLGRAFKLAITNWCRFSTCSFISSWVGTFSCCCPIDTLMFNLYPISYIHCLHFVRNFKESLKLQPVLEPWLLDKWSVSCPLYHIHQWWLEYPQCLNSCHKMEWTMRGILSSGSSPLGPALEILQEEVLVYIHHPCVGSTGQFLVFWWKLP